MKMIMKIIYHHMVKYLNKFKKENKNIKKENKYIKKENKYNFFNI